MSVSCVFDILLTFCDASFIHIFSFVKKLFYINNFNSNHQKRGLVSTDITQLPPLPHPNYGLVWD